MAVRLNEIREGMAIYDVAGDRVGKANEVGGSYVGVRTGFLGLGKHLYIPFSAFGEALDGELYLTMRKEELPNAGFDRAPAETTAPETTVGGEPQVNRERELTSQTRR